MCSVCFVQGWGEQYVQFVESKAQKEEADAQRGRMRYHATMRGQVSALSCQE